MSLFHAISCQMAGWFVYNELVRKDVTESAFRLIWRQSQHLCGWNKYNQSHEVQTGKSVSGPRSSSGTFLIWSKSASNSTQNFGLFTAFWDRQYREINLSAVTETSKPHTSRVNWDSYKCPPQGLVYAFCIISYTSSESWGWGLTDYSAVSLVGKCLVSRIFGPLALSQYLFTLTAHILGFLALNNTILEKRTQYLHWTIITKHSTYG